MPKHLATRSDFHVHSSSVSSLKLGWSGPVTLAALLVAVLGVAYIALVATVMSYGALTVEFSQSVRNDGTAVSALESRYLNIIASINDTDYAAAGYAKPSVLVYVPKAPATALR
ncbi:MAG: hypothetical protein Q8P36_02710 [bacterium]|nr:hypothetical protein [bacterium]